MVLLFIDESFAAINARLAPELGLEKHPEIWVYYFALSLSTEAIEELTI
jgi:hypothetical protein